MKQNWKSCKIPINNWNGKQQFLEYRSTKVNDNITLKYVYIGNALIYIIILEKKYK